MRLIGIPGTHHINGRDQGIAVLNDMEAAMQAEGAKELKGADAFKLYDSGKIVLSKKTEVWHHAGSI